MATTSVCIRVRISEIIRASKLRGSAVSAKINTPRKTFIRVRRNFHALNLRGPAQTAKLSENKLARKFLEVRYPISVSVACGAGGGLAVNAEDAIQRVVQAAMLCVMDLTCHPQAQGMPT